MATYADNSLGLLIRPAVAFTLLWAHSGWAQVTPQAVQPVQSAQEIPPQLADEFTGYYNGNVTAAQTSGPPAQRGERSKPGLLRGLKLRLAVGAGYDDNVFRTESNTSSDFFWSVRPELLFVGAAGKHEFDLGYEGDYAVYRDFDSEDFDDHRLFANARLDLTRKVDFNLGGHVWWGHDQRGAPGTRLINPRDLDTWREYRAKGELVFGREITRAQIIPWLEYSGIRYTNNNQSERDFDRWDYRARGRWRFTPRLYGIAEGGYAEIDHLDPRNDLDRDETELLVGMGWEATAKTSGEIMVGFLDLEFDDPNRSGSNNFNWDLRVDWTPKPYSKVTAYSFRRSQEDASGDIGTFIADTLGARWRHAFTPLLDLDTGIEYLQADYQTGREDDFLEFDLGLTYELTSWLDLGAVYRFRSRNSNLPGLDYDDHMYLIELRTGLERRL